MAKRLVFVTDVLKQLNIHIEKNEPQPLPQPYIKNTTKRIIDLNIKVKSKV